MLFKCTITLILTYCILADHISTAEYPTILPCQQIMANYNYKTFARRK